MVTKTTWLDADERRAWVGLVAVTALLEDALDEQLQREHGITYAQYTLLSRLSEADDGGLHMSELARLTHSSQSRTSHAVAQAQGRGWVVRSPCPHSVK